MLCTPCQKKLPWRQKPCGLCGQELPSSAALSCGECLKKPPIWHHFVSPWYFDQPISQLIHRCKFSFSPHLADYLGQLMAPYAQAFYDRDPVDLLVPVPLHRLRQAKRLYNQADWIARGLAKFFSCPIDTRSLKRVKYTQAQARLNSREVRRINTQSVFRVSHPPAAKHIALIDDVSTTGATATACIAAWQEVSPTRFSLWCLASGSAKRYS